MIHQKYLEQSLRIRRDFKSTDDKLLLLSETLQQANNEIKSTLEELVKIQESIDDYTDEKELMSDIESKLKLFEIEAEKVKKMYKPLNDEMESLKKEESELYDTLIKTYHNLKEEDIVKEVQDYIRNNS